MVRNFHQNHPSSYWGVAALMGAVVRAIGATVTGRVSLELGWWDAQLLWDYDCPYTHMYVCMYVSMYGITFTSHILDKYSTKYIYIYRI